MENWTKFAAVVVVVIVIDVVLLLSSLWLFFLKDCSHVSKTREEFYSVRCTVADMKNLYVSLRLAANKLFPVHH